MEAKEIKTPADHASEKVCKKLREVFGESIKKHPDANVLDFSKDEVLIEEFVNEWTWYMQGWRDENELTETLKYDIRELNNALYQEKEKSKRLTEALQSEIDRLNGLINSPEINDFIEGFKIEAAHQTERWGTKR